MKRRKRHLKCRPTIRFVYIRPSLTFCFSTCPWKFFKQFSLKEQASILLPCHVKISKNMVLVGRGLHTCQKYWHRSKLCNAHTKRFKVRGYSVPANPVRSLGPHPSSLESTRSVPTPGYIEEKRDAVGQRKIHNEKLACSRT